MPRKKVIDYFKKKGLCVNCGRKKDSPLQLCDICREKFRRERHANRAKYSAYGRSTREKRRELGVCVACGKNPPCNERNLYGKSHRHIICKECYLKDRAVHYLGDSRRWGELLSLYEGQGGRCAISGMKIEIGYNCNLDHIVPRTNQRGLTTVDNLRWVETIVNIIRKNKTDFNYEAWLKEAYESKFPSK